MVNLNECKLGDKLKCAMANWLYMSAEPHVVRLISWFAIVLSLGMPCYMRMTMEL